VQVLIHQEDIFRLNVAVNNVPFVLFILSVNRHQCSLLFEAA
jgi:hypothetical protein